MAQRGGRRRHGRRGERITARSWGLRIFAALGLAVAGYMGTVSSLAPAVAKTDPSRAYILAPGNGIIAAKYAEEALGRQPTKDPGGLPAQLAKRALLADATAAEALTVLGFQAQLRGERKKADRLFSYSTSLSRRELRPRLWAIEDAVVRGDIAGALRHYDIALRTSGDAAAMLYPTLTAALVEPRIRAELLRVLGKQPMWRNGFISYAAASSASPEGVLALITEGRTIGLKLDATQSADMVNALLAAGKRDAAWTYYNSIREGARRDRSRDPKFALSAESRAMFDWRIDGDSALGAALVSEEDAGLLDFAVPPSRGGALVSQVQLLPVGGYRLQGRSRGIDQPDTSKPFWVLTCNDGRELGRIVVPNSSQNGGRFSGGFNVPQGCPQQTLTLMARPSDNIMGVTGQIENAQLLPAGSGAKQ